MAYVLYHPSKDEIRGRKFHTRNGHKSDVQLSIKQTDQFTILKSPKDRFVE
jgi:hypothetical protein